MKSCCIFHGVSLVSSLVSGNGWYWLELFVILYVVCQLPYKCVAGEGISFHWRPVSIILFTYISIRSCNPLSLYRIALLQFSHLPGTSATDFNLLWSLYTLRPRQNGRHFTYDTFKRIFLNETFRISIKISLKFVPKGPINNIPALVQVMAWRWSGDKPLSEPVMVILLTHICVTRPQWVNTLKLKQNRCHFADVFKCIFMNEKVSILIIISLRFIPMGPINSSPPGQNERHFADVLFRCIFVYEKFCVLIKFHWNLFLRAQLTISQHWLR